MLRFVNTIPMNNRDVIFPHNPVQFFPGCQRNGEKIKSIFLVEKKKRSGRDQANPSGILKGFIKFERGVNLRSQVIPDEVSRVGVIA